MFYLRNILLDMIIIIIIIIIMDVQSTILYIFYCISQLQTKLDITLHIEMSQCLNSVH